MSSYRECCPKSVSASCRGMLLKVYMSCRGMLPKVGVVLQGNVAKSLHVLQGNVAQGGCRLAGECCPRWVSSCRGMLPKVGVVLQGNVAQSGCCLAGERCPRTACCSRNRKPDLDVRPARSVPALQRRPRCTSVVPKEMPRSCPPPCTEVECEGRRPTMAVL